MSRVVLPLLAGISTSALAYFAVNQRLYSTSAVIQENLAGVTQHLKSLGPHRSADENRLSIAELTKARWNQLILSGVRTAYETDWVEATLEAYSTARTKVERALDSKAASSNP